MQQGEIFLHIIKLVLSGVAAFLAIMLWSRTKDGAWMSLIAGTIINYTGIVYNILKSFGIIAGSFLVLAGTSCIELFFVGVPFIFYIITFILLLIKSR
jgi:hypothetical protein